MKFRCPTCNKKLRSREGLSFHLENVDCSGYKSKKVKLTSKKSRVISNTIAPIVTPIIVAPDKPRKILELNSFYCATSPSSEHIFDSNLVCQYCGGIRRDALPPG